METFRIWLESDKEIPQFKRLIYEKVDVPLSDVITRGIHPNLAENTNKTLGDRFAKILNKDEFKIEELAEAHYCQDVSHTGYYAYYFNKSPFEETLNQIRCHVYFVDNLSYLELLTLAKERLKKDWSHEVAYDLLRRSVSDFNALRSFLKEKDKSIKLSGYEDIKRYDLGRILCLDDFEGEDNILISVGIPTTNFRSAQVIKKVADEHGFLKLTDVIKYFQVRLEYQEPGIGFPIGLVYNCVSNNGTIRLQPELDADIVKRNKALELASKWRTDKGRYCFSTDISSLSKMVEQDDCSILFSTLDYLDEKTGYISYSEIQHSEIRLFAVENHIDCISSNNVIKNVLQNYGVSMTGRKEELLDKLVNLAVEMYQKLKAELDRYFINHKFIRIAYDTNMKNKDKNAFPILQKCELNKLILTMYIMKHLRGNVVLEASYSNETYDLLPLVKSLINKDVSLHGSFLPVE
jgi:hypothetical protein